jgi:Ca2+/Na+ antiporter
MQKKPARLWITALFLGWCVDFLFFSHAPGISFAIYVLLTLLAGFVLLWLDGFRPARNTLLLLPLILFFAMMTFIRMEALSVFLATAFTLFLMAGLAVTYRGGEWLRYSLADYFARGFDLLGSLATRPFIFAVGLKKLQDNAEGTHKPDSRIWPVLRGIAIAIPVVAFFASLLASADLVFAQRLSDITAIFKLENLPEYIFRFTYILICAFVLAGVYLHAAQRSSDEKLLGLEKPVVPAFFGFTEASIVLGSVVVLFATFVLIQFQYFFGGLVNIHLDGYTYADYARKGFGELVGVAFFALLLFLGLTTITKRETTFHQKMFSGLGVSLLALVAVMLVSAYQRLALYENAYGFTRLRTYTHVFMVWIAILLAVVVVLELIRRQRIFALAALLATLGFAISLNLLNVDAFIFQRNLARFEQGQMLDVGYLASLSSDAVPGMVKAYENPLSKIETRDRLGAVLVCFQHANNFSDQDQSWQAFHLSRYQALTSLQQVSPSLKAYQLDASDWPVTVTTPLAAKYDCSSDSMMD